MSQSGFVGKDVGDHTHKSFDNALQTTTAVCAQGFDIPFTSAPNADATSG